MTFIICSYAFDVYISSKSLYEFPENTTSMVLLCLQFHLQCVPWILADREQIISASAVIVAAAMRPSWEYARRVQPQGVQFPMRMRIIVTIHDHGAQDPQYVQGFHQAVQAQCVPSSKFPHAGLSFPWRCRPGNTVCARRAC